mmetsp:Transcript_23654/g.59887  ORF Transcript_23654/g.59887 Transcript_23654/m.59887 type:complete len:267 (+) Transcript_23654:3089-3889(+)
METRTYELIYPFTGNVTITLIKEIKEMGAYSFLSEYGNALGMLMMSELSRRRIRSLNKFIKIGKMEVVVVVRVDFSKGYIDLSKRRIAEGETFCMEKKWNYSRIVNTITNQVSKLFFIGIEDSRIRWSWPLHRHFGHAIIGFKKFLENSETLTKSLDIFWKEKIKICEIVKKKLPKNFKKISSSFEIGCFSPGGISIVKNAIESAISNNNVEKINVRLISGPLYNLIIKNGNKRKGLKILIKFFSLISEKIQKHKGRLDIKDINLD